MRIRCTRRWLARERASGSRRTMGPRYSIGVDFGTESGRAVLVDLATAASSATAVYGYANGVIDEHLPAPDDDVRLPPDWALQDPIDYLRTFQATVPAVLAHDGVDPADVVGVGIDFTACTMLPTTADGTPLCMIAGLPPRAARLGQAVEAPRRPARGRPHQRRSRASGARPGSRATAARSRRSGSSQEPPDPRRGARRLSRRRPPDRGRRLGRLAADRRRDAQQLHRRLQGDLVEGGRLPGAALLRRARSALRVGRRREDVPRSSRRSAAAPAG